VSTIFVAGATGVVGRRAVRLLVEAGHQVAGVARSDEKAALLESIGARPVRVDLFDAAAVKDAVAGVRSEVVVNLATHIPRAAKGALPGAWAENDRVRREVSRNLMDAALAAGASRYVQESITFGYADAGDRWITEADPYTRREYASVHVAEANAHRFTEAGGIGVVLRFGMFYDAGSHTVRDLVRGLSSGRLLLPGAAGAYASFVATDDAAAAVVAALDAPAGTYNVVDDEPLTRAEIARIASTAVGRPVKLLPSLVGRAMATKAEAEPLSRSQRVSNAAFKGATGWSPTHAPSLRTGLPPVVHEVLAASPPAGSGSLAVRVLLALLVPATVVVGLWGAFAPRSFFDDFPGLGLVWVASDGPFNEHLVRDFGATNLAIAVLLVVAVWKGGRVLLATAAGAYLAYAVPHLVYHLRHTGVIAGADRATSLGSLAVAVVVAAAALGAVTIHRRDMTR
jgi:nucleoside-diphosphate-sugar epimerase